MGRPFLWHSARCVLAEADHVTVTVFNLNLPRVVERVFRASNDPGTFGLKFFLKSSQIGHPDIDIPRRVGVDLAIRARRASTRGTQGNLNRISKQNYETRRLTPVSVEVESKDIAVVLRRLDHVIDKKAGRDAAEFFT